MKVPRSKLPASVYVLLVAVVITNALATFVMIRFILL